VAYSNRWEERGLVKVFTGDISGEEVLKSTSEVHGDPRFDNLKYVINDFLQVDDARATDQDIARLAAIDRAASRSNPNIRIAVVTKREDIRHWAEQYVKYSVDCPYETQLFTDIEAARSWIS